MSNIGNKEVLSKNLKYYISKSNKDRRELAEIWGFPYSTVTEWINGKKYPRMDKVEKLAEYFGIPKSDLIEERKVVYIKDKVSKATSQNIKMFREEAGISIIEFANLLNVDEKTVLDIESGKLTPDKELLFSICDVLHTTPDFLDGTIVELLEDGDYDAEYRYLKQQQLPPDSEPLTGREQALISLFRRISEEDQPDVLMKIFSALDNPKQ